MSYSGAVRTLTAYNAWANDGLFTILETTDEVQRIPEAPILLAILNHAHVVSQIFRAHMTGESHEYQSANPEYALPLDEVSASARAIDAWYCDYAHSLNETELTQRIDFCFTSGEKASMTRAEMILHVVNHGTYHRGNAGVILQKNGILPNRDVITDFLSARSVTS